MRFQNKVVLITGAGAGIGRAAAMAFAREGAHVAMLDRSAATQDSCMTELAHLGATGLFLTADVTDEAAVQSVIHQVVTQFGRLDVLVNCAGVVIPGTLETTTAAQLRTTMEVNVMGLFLMCKYVVEQMRKTGGGAVVNISSSVALRGVKDRIAYTASKGAVLSMTRAMAMEYMRDGVRFNCICPGTTQTPSFNDRVNAFADRDAALRDFIDRQPMGRLGTAEELAEGILFAACETVSFLNGAVLSIDGGMTV